MVALFNRNPSMTRLLLHLVLLAPLPAVAQWSYNPAQYYVDEATEYMERGLVHYNRFSTSKGKDIREFAYSCSYGLKAVQALDNAIRVAGPSDAVGLAARRFDIVGTIYNKCGSYWPKKYGGVCEYDFKNKGCDALKWGLP